MKIASIAVAAVLITTVHVNAGGYNFPAFFRGANRVQRALASQQCLDETDGLFVDDSVAAAFDAMNEEIQDRAGCSGVELDKDTCTVDFETFDTHEQFEKACADMGGKTITVDAVIDCGYSASQISRQELTVNGFTFSYNNMMDCVSMECDDEGIKEKIDAEISKVATTLESSMVTTCSYTMDVSSTSSTSDEESLTTGEDGSTGTAETEEVPAPSSSAQCRSLLSAVIGVPLLNMALAV
ncbi:hypothetical protein ACHAXA_002892 [Cyclostephanos tholiformis]|uniref:Uncharacterized protein n=1 Tax=Cyclostephanos tholiformis TaxID=382380 RepID=A0ABD3SG60_9STRA